MASNLNHANEAQLEVLLFGDEESVEFRATAAHVETCNECRKRLDVAAGPFEIDAEARELLSDYPWEDSSRSRAGNQSIDVARDTPTNLDYLNPPSHPEMLGRLGRYEVERIIGSGGMGIVLKAFDTELNRPIAIKVLAQHLAHRGAARKRFAREAKAAAGVVHEHVVAVHNVEAERHLPFLVMQYVAGESLQARVDRDGPLDAKEILRIGIQAASGLAAAHEQGVVHRDVKPANILLEEGVERVLLTDFGLARTVDDASLTHTGVIAGTPHYMSPEQANGEPTDYRTDLFSLGSVLYFMATGHPPFRAEGAMGVLHRICHDRHRRVWQINADIPDELSGVIDRLLKKKAARRPATAIEVTQSLKRILSNLQTRSHFGRFPRLAGVALWGLAAMVAAVAAILFALMPAIRTEPTDNGLAGVTNAATAPARTKASTDLLAADYAAEFLELREITQRLRRLEAMSEASGFARAPESQFLREVRSLDVRLSRLNSVVVPDSSSLQQNGSEQ